jgi:carbonic anhydrase
MRRAAFVGGTLAATAGLGLPRRTGAATPAGPSESPNDALDRLMAGNKRFVNSDFPPIDKAAERREMGVTGQAPFAAVLTCADSRVIPNLVFVQGLGDLFVVRVAGNFPDDLALGSLEYAVEHLGSRLIMVLGHESCGAVKATYDAIRSKTTLPKHLSTIQRLITPGIMHVVISHGSQETAVRANVQAAVGALQAAPPVISKGVGNGHLRVVGAEYHLGSGAVTLV